MHTININVVKGRSYEKHFPIQNLLYESSITQNFQIYGIAASCVGMTVIILSFSPFCQASRRDSVHHWWGDVC